MIRDDVDSRSIDVAELQSKLVAMGGYLPNAAK